MKLIFCQKCQDIFKPHEGRSCKCGNVHARYTDDLNIEISVEDTKTILVLGIDNHSFAKAIRDQEHYGDLEMDSFYNTIPGRHFESFIIPTKCKTVHFEKYGRNSEEN